MTAPKKPMDRLPKMANKHPVQLRNALSLQAANLLQKAQLDNMATKIIMVLRIVKPIAESKKVQPTIAKEIATILTMDRDAAAAARTTFEYPDVKIQAVIDKAVDEITAILLDDVG